MVFHRFRTKRLQVGRWWWLRRNEFFETTHLSGYLFITKAKSIVEVCFWYGALIVFTALTIRNVTDTVIYYLSAPTKATANIAANASNASILDLKISINSSMIDFLQDPISSIDAKSYWVKSDPDDSKLLKSFGYDDAFSPNFSCFRIFYNGSNTDREKKQYIEGILEMPPEIVHSVALAEDLQDHSKYPLWIQKRWYELQDTIQSLWKPFWDIAFEKPGKYIKATTTPHDSPKYRGIFDCALEAANYDASGSNWLLSAIQILKETQSGAVDKKELIQLVERSLENKFFIEADEDTTIHLSEMSSDRQSWTNGLTYSIGLAPMKTKVQLNISLASFGRRLIYLDTVAQFIKQMRSADPDITRTVELFYTGPNYECLDIIEEDLQKLFELTLNYYRESLIITMNSPYGVMRLTPFTSTQLKLRPSVRFVSQTESCYTGSLDKCMLECSYEANVHDCQCHTMQQRHLDKSGSPVCNSHCNITKDCMEQCEQTLKDSCDQTLYRLETSSEPQRYLTTGVIRVAEDKPPTPAHKNWWEGYLFSIPEIHLQIPILQVEIQAQQIHNYAMYTREYSMTSGTLMSELGGLVDFYLGINVVGLLHMVVYLAKQIGHASNSNSATGRTIRAMFGIKVSDGVQSNMAKLKKKLRTLRRKRITWSKLWFLHDNSFFQSTSLIGYLHISQASSKIEAVLWYLTIVVFSGLTARNLKEALSFYNSKPTSTSLKMLTENPNAGIPNFTLIHAASLFDFLTSEDLSTDYTTHEKHFINVYTNALDLCQNGTTTIDETNLHMRNELLYQERDEINGMRYVQMAHDALQWKYEMELFWVRLLNQHMSAPTWTGWYKQTIGLLTQALNAVNINGLMDDIVNALRISESDKGMYMHAHVWSTVFVVGLSHLEATKQGRDWREIYYEDTYDPITQRKDKKHAINMMGNISKSYGHITSYLYKHFKLSIGKISLTKHRLKHNKAAQETSYRVTLPPNRKNVTIELYSMNFARFLTVHNFYVEQLKLLFKQNCKKRVVTEHINLGPQTINCGVISNCFGGDGLAKSIMLKHIQRTLLDVLFELLKQTVTLTIAMPGGSITLNALKNHNIVVQAASQFTSKTTNCYVGLFDDCVDSCVVDKFLDSCSCVPWHMLYVGKGSMCEQHCNASETKIINRCQYSCGLKIAHSCDTAIYEIKTSTSKSIGYLKLNLPSLEARVNTNLPVLSFTMQLKQDELFAHFTEEYDLDLGKFMAQVGGIFELWLGISVVGVIHAVKYLARQAWLARNPATKTGATVRRLIH